MLKSAGIAQRKSAGASPPEVPGSSPAPRSTILQALVAGLQYDVASRDAGHADGLARRHWSPGGHDEFSYALGFADGRARARKQGRLT